MWGHKHAKQMAALVDVERLIMQAFIGTALWDYRLLITVFVGQVVDRLREPEGILAFDPSSFPKRGTHSVGVKRQWCGHRGTVDNCQVGVCIEVYLGESIGCHGVTGTRKVCRAQHRSNTRSRTPCVHTRLRSMTMRQRCTRLLRCSIRRRRQCRAWLGSVCARVRSSPRGFLVGMRLSTWGSLKARKPRSCPNRLPAGEGEGVASAMGVSWVQPP